MIVAPNDRFSGAVQRALHWNASAGSLEIVDALTIKPDGTRIAAPRDMIIESTQSERDGVFMDQRYRVITYIDVDPGDRVVLKARHRRTIPFFSGHFFDTRDGPGIPSRDFRIVYDVPDSMILRADAFGFELDAEERANGRRIYRWRHNGYRPARDEHQVVAATDYADRLSVSSMRDYRELAHTYLSGAYRQADPTPAIRDLAASITGGARTTRERAAALYDWVRLNVRYGGAHLGQASVVPKPAQRTLDEREGDCKDQAALFEALLSAVGIDSSPVMVNATEAYRIPSVPTLGVFNHVMTWIPALQLFADTSASHIEFGDLPSVVSDKPVLIIKTAQLARTPVQRPLTHSIVLSGEIEIDGTARFRLEDTASGWFAGARRRFFASADRSVLSRTAQGILYVSRLVGETAVERGDDPGDPIADRGSVRLVMTGTVSGLVTTGADPAIRALSSLGVGITHALIDFHSHRSHSAPSICLAVHVDERADWVLADGLRIVSLPGPLAIDGAGFRYRSAYRRVANRLVIERSLRMDFDSNACTPERFRIVQRLAQDVLADLEKSARLASTVTRPARR